MTKEQNSDLSYLKGRFDEFIKNNDDFRAAVFSKLSDIEKKIESEQAMDADNFKEVRRRIGLLETFKNKTIWIMSFIGIIILTIKDWIIEHWPL